MVYKIGFMIAMTFLMMSCGDGDLESQLKEIQENLPEQAYSSDDEKPQPIENADAFLSISGFADGTFEDVYSYQANLTNNSMFVHLVFDPSEDENYKAISLNIQQSETGEIETLKETGNEIYVEVDGKAFRTAAGEGKINITSLSDGFMEGTFSGTNIKVNQNLSDELITIEEGSFKLPLNDMRRK